MFVSKNQLEMNFQWQSSFLDQTVSNSIKLYQLVEFIVN